MPEAKVSVIPDIKPLLAIVKNGDKISALKDGAWHEDWHGSYCRNTLRRQRCSIKHFSSGTLSAHNRAAASYSMAPGFRGIMWESDPPPISCKHILAKNDDPFPSNLYIPTRPLALNHLVIELPSCLESSKLFVHWVRYSNHLKGSSQRPSSPLMFIMSISLSSALQHCTVCFYKGVRIWMGAWVPVWCRGGGEQNQICFSLKMKGGRAFTVSDVCLCQVWGRVCVCGVCVFT